MRISIPLPVIPTSSIPTDRTDVNDLHVDTARQPARIHYTLFPGDRGSRLLQAPLDNKMTHLVHRRLAVSVQPVPKQDAEARKRNFDETRVRLHVNRAEERLAQS